MTTTRRRPHRLTRIALVTAVAIFPTGGCLSFWQGISIGIGAHNYSLEDQLIEAAKRGNQVSIEDLLDRGADIEAQKDNGDTALMAASSRGGVAVVELLLDRGADIDVRNDDGWTALMVASNYGHDEVAAVLRAWITKHRPRR